ncbi:MAG: peptidylprolyl isomerase [Saprospiraceae bacterium]
MALIGKIRNNFWFVLLLLGFALAAFILMDIDNAGNQGGIGPKQIVGEIAGTKIDYRDFQKAETALYSGGDNFAGKTGAWNYFVEKAIIDKQAESIGLNVSVPELMELQFGNNLSPVIQNYFRNRQTNQVDMQQLLNVKQSIESGDRLNPDFEMKWIELQKQIIKTSKQDKLSNLVSKAIYTPNFVAERAGINTSTKATFDYVKIPFSNIPDNGIEVKNSDLDAYIANNSTLYTNDEETRVLDYLVLNVYPTANDSAKVFADLAGRSETFKNKAIGTEDSIYTINNEGFYSPFYSATDKLTGSIKSNVSTMNIGDVYGPYIDKGAYFLAKLVGKSVVPDSVSASHILRSVTDGNVAQLLAANKIIDSLENVVRSGKTSFADLAKEYSQDPGSGTKGGDLGTFAQGTMVPEFNKACFINSKNGGYYRVTTQFGVHWIKVKNRIFNNRDPKYKMAFIRSVILPSEDTQNALYEKADQINTENRTLETLKTAIAGQSNMSIESSSPLKSNDFVVGNLGSGETSREMVKWAFDDEIAAGKVSGSIYTFTDPVNYFNSKYVITGLNRINSAGLAKADDVRASIEATVKNELKGKKLASQISGSDLEAIAGQHNGSYDTASDVLFSASGVTGLGNEPKVLAAAFTLAEGGVSKPIIGNTGVYIIKTTAKTEGAIPSNVLSQKRQLNNSNRNRVGYGLMNSLKKLFKPTDNRSKYF